jgi:putative DNA primase/helicase
MTRTSKGSGLVPKAGGDSVPDDARALTDVEMAFFEFTQPEYADELVKRYGDRFRHITAEKLDLYYSDGRWREDEYDAMFHFCETMCREIYEAEPPGEDGKPNPRKTAARKRLNTGQIEAICRIARTRRPIVSTRRKFDADPYLINMPNGTYDLRDAMIHDHDPNDMITKITVGKFDPDAIGATFDGYFEAVQPAAHNREQILRNIGYSICGTYGEYAFVHVGSGGNGKSTMLKLVDHAFGDYSGNISWKVLSAKAEDQHETIFAELEGMHCAIVQMGGRALSPDQLRTIVAEPDFKARQMRQDSRTITSVHTFHVAQNDPPPMRQLDASTRRRIIVHEWNADIVHPDEMLPSRLRLEADYVLTMIIDAYHRWSESEMSRDDTEEYFEKNSIYAFVNTKCDTTNRLAWTGATALFTTYEEWCKEEGIRAEAQQQFGRVLTQLGYTKPDDHKRVAINGKLQQIRQGIQLKG